jgi:hypothetical protein
MPQSLSRDAAIWLNTIRLHGRVRLKHISYILAQELIQARFARLSGVNLVITSVGMNGSPPLATRTHVGAVFVSLH